MIWPERPTIHAGERHYTGHEDDHWRPPQPDREPYGTTFRTCSYCGSIHPGDLVDLMRRHEIRIDRADMKYGYPHKFYVEGIPNPLAGKMVEVGSVWAGGVTTPTIGEAPRTTFAKFYTRHLVDAGYSHDALDAIVAEINRRSAITFVVNPDGRVGWHLPGTPALN